MISLNHCNLVHKFIPMPQAMKILDAIAAVVKSWEKLEKILAWRLTKVRNKKEVIEEARNKRRKVHFASLMVFVILRIFIEPGPSASQVTAAKVIDVISRLPGCSCQAADAVFACAQVKMEDAQTLL